MKTTILATGSLLLAASLMNAQTNPIIPLGGPGTAEASRPVKPYLELFEPESTLKTGAAMVICPGGSYAKLAEHEGAHYARWLNEVGITCFVLHYRLGSEGFRHPAMLQDGLSAIRTVRARAQEWGVDPGRIGIMGSSAGGHLAAMVLTHFDEGDPAASDPLARVSSRPDLGVLCYPVITMRPEYTHRGSQLNLLGSNPPPELVEFTSAELHVSSNTPPCFIWHTWQDTGVSPMNSLMFAEALHRARVPFELHVFERGPHGIGLGTRTWEPARRHPWTARCIEWLQLHGFARTNFSSR